MARAPKTKPGTEVVNWEEQMAQQAEVAAASQRATGSGGAFVSMKAGQLSFDGNPMPGNQMPVIVLGAVMENSYFDSAYDPDTPTAPKCFAFAEREDDLEPHSEVDKVDYFERQSDSCAECPMNQWGSARTGKGKACSNVMRLALLPAGVYKPMGGRNAGYDLELIDDPDVMAAAGVVYIKIPVMSVRNFADYVKSLAAELRRPPWGVVTNLFLTPSERSQFTVNFEVIENLAPEMLQVVMPRHDKEMEAIGFPYSPPMVAEEQAAKPSSNKLSRPKAAPAKPAAKARR